MVYHEIKYVNISVLSVAKWYFMAKHLFFENIKKNMINGVHLPNTV